MCDYLIIFLSGLETNILRLTQFIAFTFGYGFEKRILRSLHFILPQIWMCGTFGDGALSRTICCSVWASRCCVPSSHSSSWTGWCLWSLWAPWLCCLRPCSVCLSFYRTTTTAPPEAWGQTPLYDPVSIIQPPVFTHLLSRRRIKTHLCVAVSKLGLWLINSFAA